MSFKPISKVFTAILALVVLLVVIHAFASHYKPADPPAPSRAELEQAARAEVARNQEEGRRAKEEAKRAEQEAAKTARAAKADAAKAAKLPITYSEMRAGIENTLHSSLNDPDSLRDLIIVNIEPVASMGCKATAAFRAKNGFNALRVTTQDFVFKRPCDEKDMRFVKRAVKEAVDELK